MYYKSFDFPVCLYPNIHKGIWLFVNISIMFYVQIVSSLWINISDKFYS